MTEGKKYHVDMNTINTLDIVYEDRIVGLSDGTELLKLNDDYSIEIIEEAETMVLERKMKILMVYAGCFNEHQRFRSLFLMAISKEEGVDYRVFETTEYSDKFSNKHIQLAAVGANRGNEKNERDDEYYETKPESEIIQN